MKDHLEQELWKIHQKSNDWEETTLSENEIKRLTNLTMAKIENQKNTTNSEKKKSRFKKLSTRSAVIFASIALAIVVTAGFGFAFHWNEGLVRFFNLYGKEDSTLVQGEDLNVSQTVNGVKVTAEQVVGDENGCSILLKVTGTDYQTCFGFQDVDIKIKGAKELKYTDLMPMGADEGVDSYVLNLRTPESLEGKKIQLSLKNYVDVAYDLQGNEIQSVVAKGTWNLDFTLNYTQKNTDYETDQDIDLFGGTAKFTKVSISPFSVTVTYKDLENDSVDSLDSNTVIKVQLKSGDVINSARAQTEDVVYDDENGRIIFYLNRVIADKEVESVTFAGKTVTVHQNDNPLKTTLYENTEMGYSIQVPQELYDILQTPKTTTYHNKDFDCDAVKTEFVGKIKGVTMDMFTIVELKGITETQAQVEATNPMCAYLGTTKNGTYVLQYGELQTDAQYELFPDILNKYVSNISQRVDLTPVK